jgi:hypothetical protein
MQERSLAFGKKRLAKVERILADKRDLENRMDQIGANCSAFFGRFLSVWIEWQNVS